jgi:hypothetical protein
MSLPGLTRLRGRSRFGVAKARQSIVLRSRMDARVEPGHDKFLNRDMVEGAWRSNGNAPTS